MTTPAARYDAKFIVLCEKGNNPCVSSFAAREITPESMMRNNTTHAFDHPCVESEVHTNTQ